MSGKFHDFLVDFVRVRLIIGLIGFVVSLALLAVLFYIRMHDGVGSSAKFNSSVSRFHELSLSDVKSKRGSYFLFVGYRDCPKCQHFAKVLSDVSKAKGSDRDIYYIAFDKGEKLPNKDLSYLKSLMGGVNLPFFGRVRDGHVIDSLGVRPIGIGVSLKGFIGRYIKN